MSPRRCLPLILFLVCVVAAPLAHARPWKSADGKFSVEAEFIAVEGTDVKLKTAEGKEISVPLSKLSTSDRLFALAEKKKAAAKKTEDAPPKTSDAGPAAGNEQLPKLTTLQFKYWGREYAIDARPDSKAQVDEDKVRIMYGKFCDIVITPNRPRDLEKFKSYYTNPADSGYTVQRKFAEDETTAAYHSVNKGDNSESIVFSTIVTVGDRKFTCEYPEVVVRQLTAEEVPILLRSAKTLRQVSPPVSDTPSPPPVAAPAGGGKPLFAKDAPTAPLTVTINGKEYTLDAPVGATVDRNLVLPHVKHKGELLFLIQPTEPQEMAGFRQFCTATEGNVVKQKLAETDETSAYVIHNELINADTPMFLTQFEVGGKKLTCVQNEIRPSKLTAEDLAFVIKCARSLKAK